MTDTATTGDARTGDVEQLGFRSAYGKLRRRGLQFP